MPTSEELKILQALPLDIKIMKTRQRIREWIDYYGENGVYIAFSGGKDSTVLLDIVGANTECRSGICKYGIGIP